MDKNLKLKYLYAFYFLDATETKTKTKNSFPIAALHNKSATTSPFPISITYETSLKPRLVVVFASTNKLSRLNVRASSHANKN